MTTNVNPPLNLRAPRRLSGDPESDAFFRQLITILFQLWERTGGGDDAVSSLEAEQPDTDTLFGLFPRIEEIDSEQVDTDALYALFPRTEQLESELEAENSPGTIPYLNRRTVVVTSTNHTTAGDELVLATNGSAVTVTLNPTPDDLESASIKRTNGPVRIESSKTVDGKTALIINTRYTGLDLLYTVETDSWHIV